MKHSQLATGLSALALAACAAVNGSGHLTGVPATSVATNAVTPDRHVGLVKIMTPRGGGIVEGFDVNQDGSDGVLAAAKEISSNAFAVSVQTFDTATARITKSFANYSGGSRSYSVNGIFANDVALITRVTAPKGSKFYAPRRFEIMNPVTSHKFTGPWTPPAHDGGFTVLQRAVNQSTTTSVLYGIELKNNDIPDLIVSNVGANASTKRYHLPVYGFSEGDLPQVAQDTANNRAIIATSLDGGARGGPPPVIATVDLNTGKMKEFTGVDCPGSSGCGTADGIAYDSKTGVACTDTALDHGVEFYHIAQKSGFWVSMPGKGSLGVTGGSKIANDPLHRLFLVAQPYSSTSSSGSSVQVFDERGHVVESINGLNFANVFESVFPFVFTIQPSTRIGWISGPGFNQVQKFSY